MRVVIAAFDAASSGVGTYTIELCKLLRQQYDLCLVSFAPIDIPGVQVRLLKPKSLRAPMPFISGLVCAHEVRRIAEDFGADVVHETLPPLGALCKTLVTTVWGYTGLSRTIYNRLRADSIYAGFGAVPVTIQHWMGDRISKGIAAYQVSLNPLGEGTVPPPMEPQSQLPERKLDPFRLLFVARRLENPRKNLALVVRAVSLCSRRIDLHVVGGGAPPLGATSHGVLPREAILDLMGRVSALVLPSTYEEVGYVGVEAASLGLPVFASDIPSFRTFLPHSIFFNPSSARDLASKLDVITLEELNCRGRSSYSDRCRSQKTLATHLEAAYSRLVASSSTG